MKYDTIPSLKRGALDKIVKFKTRSQRYDYKQDMVDAE